jgi:hypothetical protein
MNRSLLPSTMKRKRKAGASTRPSKKPKVQPDESLEAIRRSDASEASDTHPVLSCYYRHICSLRAYIVARLAKVDAKKSIAVRRLSVHGCANESQKERKSQEPESFDDFLDNIVVATNIDVNVDEIRPTSRYAQDLATFSEQAPLSKIGGDHPPGGRLQNEVGAFPSCVLPFRARLFPFWRCVCHGSKPDQAT